MKKRIGIYAASSIVPIAELELGTSLLKDYGFEVTIHPQVRKQEFMYPGTDEERAAALYDFACDDNIDILWAARGGYGAGRLTPILEEMTKKRGKPTRAKNCSSDIAM